MTHKSVPIFPSFQNQLSSPTDESEDKIFTSRKLLNDVVFKHFGLRLVSRNTEASEHHKRHNRHHRNRKNSAIVGH